MWDGASESLVTGSFDKVLATQVSGKVPAISLQRRALRAWSTQHRARATHEPVYRSVGGDAT